MNERRSLLNYIFSKEDIPKDAVAVTADNYQNTYGNTIYIPYETPIMSSAFLIELVKKIEGKRVPIIEFAGARPGDQEEFIYGSGNLVIKLGYTNNTHFYPSMTPYYMPPNMIYFGEGSDSTSPHSMSVPYGPIIQGTNASMLTYFNNQFPNIAKDSDEDLYFKIVLGRPIRLNSADYLQYYSSIYLYEDPNITTPYGLHYDSVDLGLPSGLLWATTDIGTEEIGVCGKYFAWGNIYGIKTSQLSYSTRTPKKAHYLTSEDSYEYSKYNSTDGLIKLLSVDDAATIYMGDEWRMPTREDYQELIDNCTISIQTVNGVDCAIFTSNINSNYIIFPNWGFIYSDRYRLLESYFIRFTSEISRGFYPYLFSIDVSNITASIVGNGSPYIMRSDQTPIRGVKNSE